MCQKLIKLGSYVHHSRRCLLLYDHIRDFVTVRLPVWFGDREVAREIRSVTKRAGQRKRASKRKVDASMGERGTNDCVLRASRQRMAFLRFPSESSMIFCATSVGRGKLTRFATCFIHSCICESC